MIPSEHPYPVFEGRSLPAVLEEARHYVLRCGRRRLSARGETFSVSGVRLSWQVPESFHYWGWDREATEAYYQTFVEKRPQNAPERLAEKGELIFPYTYAARSRFWDGGWGAAQAVLEATRELRIPFDVLVGSETAFRRYLAQAGERVHLQVLLAVWAWLGAEGMKAWLQDTQPVQTLTGRTRVDQLERILREIEHDPASRRAVTASFVLPNLDQSLARLQSLPPYQFFQLLPGERDEPLNSFHVHRSLDASDGVQLDFYHDYRWLGEACRRLDRPMGTISVVAGDFHVYMGAEGPLERGSLADWLVKVTDGYRTGEGRAKELLGTPAYEASSREIFRRLRA
jgi:hypothetical protein